MSWIVNEYVGGISFFLLFGFCIKMHKVARGKELAMVEKNVKDVI